MHVKAAQRPPEQIYLFLARGGGEGGGPPTEWGTTEQNRFGGNSTTLLNKVAWTTLNAELLPMFLFFLCF